MDANKERHQEDDGVSNSTTVAAISPWRIASWICAGVIVISVLACVVIAVMRSEGITLITVTALDPESEPRDHDIPLIRQKEALPDYELIVVLTDGEVQRFGSKPDTSAADGLIWTLPDPPSVKIVAAVRLQERDKVVSDAVAEVQIAGSSVTDQNYRFDFTTERSINVGVSSFFATPVGKAIAWGFCIAVLLLLASIFLG